MYAFYKLRFQQCAVREHVFFSLAFSFSFPIHPVVFFLLRRRDETSEQSDLNYFEFRTGLGLDTD